MTVRQPKSGKEVRHDLMVMENLTFGHNIVRQYDLKGALHARFNAVVDGSEDVLLDQNFVNDMNTSPVYVSNKAKRLLQRAVWNDTTFLNVSHFICITFQSNASRYSLFKQSFSVLILCSLWM